MNCVDCGKETMGVRCQKCNGRFIQRQFANALAGSDSELLAMRDVEHLSMRRIADRLSISPSRVRQRLQDARRREKVRQGDTP